MATLPLLRCRVLLFGRRTLHASGDAERLASVEAVLKELERLIGAPALVWRDGDDWLVQQYANPLPFRPRLTDIVVSGLETAALLVDGHHNVGRLAPGEPTPAPLGLTTAHLGLDSTQRTLRQALNLENLERALSSRAPLPVAPRARLFNDGANVRWRPHFAFAPGADAAALGELVAFLNRQRASKHGETVKAGGSRHSWSRAAETSAIYVEPAGLSFVTPLLADDDERAILRPGFGDRADDLFVIGSGTVIRDINSELWAHGKALPVLGGFDGQTLAGIVQTGTHGSVLRSPCIAAAVVQAINCVDAAGQLLRIERRDGPSDPAAFAARRPGWQLRQDDELFDAALIAVGSFGVVYSYVVAATDAFYLTETRSILSLTALRELLRGGNIYRLMNVDVPDWVAPDDNRRLKGHDANVYHLEFLVNPYRVGSDHTVIATSRAIFFPDGPEQAEMARARRADENLFRMLFVPLQFTRPAISVWVTEHLGGVLWKLPLLLSRYLPHTVPTLLDAAMRQIKDDAYEARSYNVFNIGDGTNAIPALSSEPSVPLRDDLYLDALDLILARVDYFQKRGRLHTAPISLRFVAGTTAMLGDDLDACRFEIIFTARTRHATALVHDYEEQLYARFGGKARPHWGQINHLNRKTRARLPSMYSRFERWQALRRTLDPADIFLNDWQRDIFGPP